MNLEEIYGKFPNFEYRTRKPLNSLVENIGINNAPFVVKPQIEGKQINHPAYIVWQSMLNRCYNTKVKEEQPAYVGVTCCDARTTTRRIN